MPPDLTKAEEAAASFLEHGREAFHHFVHRNNGTRIKDGNPTTIQFPDGSCFRQTTTKKPYFRSRQDHNVVVLVEVIQAPEVVLPAQEPPRFCWEGDLERRMNIETHSLSRGTPLGLDMVACDALQKEDFIRCINLADHVRHGSSKKYRLTDKGRARRTVTESGCTVSHCPCKRSKVSR